MIVIFSLFLISFCKSDPNLQINVALKDCSPKELVVAQGKCSLYVNDLMFLTEEYKSFDVPLEAAQNMSKACQSITSCFSGIECADGQKNKEMYEKKCDKLEFTNYGLDMCMRKFYDIVYKEKNNCSKDFDYFSNDMSVKRIAYTSGKSCFMEIVKNNCSSNAFTYLNSNYDKFLNSLTVPTNDAKCASLHDQLMSMQCEPIMMDMALSTMGMPIPGDAEGIKIMTRSCWKMKNCTDNLCSTKANDTLGAGDLCSEMEKYTSGFNACFLKIKRNPANLRMYPCIHQMGPSSSSFAKEKSSENDECIKSVMKEECGESAVANFDEDLAAFRNEKKTTRKPLID